MHYTYESEAEGREQILLAHDRHTAAHVRESLASPLSGDKAGTPGATGKTTDQNDFLPK